MAFKPELLYISPVVPALAGNGLAIRAGTVLEALADQASVSLLVVSLYPSTGRLPQELARLCRRYVFTTPARMARRQPSFLPASLKGLFGRNPYPESRFDVVHVFRLSMLPFSLPYLDRASSRHLDIDDIESVTHRRIAALCRLNGDVLKAAYYESQARH